MDERDHAAKCYKCGNMVKDFHKFDKFEPTTENGYHSRTCSFCDFSKNSACIENYDYVVDAIDTITSKIELAKRCEELEKQENETRALYDQNVKNIVQLQNELSKYKDKELTYRDNIGKLTSERNSLSKENEQLISKAESLTADIEKIIEKSR